MPESAYDRIRVPLLYPRPLSLEADTAPRSRCRPMTAARSSPLVATVIDSLGRVPGILTDSHTAVVAATLAGLSWMVGAANLRLLGVVTAAMLLNLVVGSLWAVLNPAERFCGRKLYGGILGKVLRLLVVPLASCADWLILAAPFAGQPDPTAYSFPISAYVMWALAVAELVSSAQKLIEAGIIPGALRAFISYLQARGPTLPAPEPTPAPAAPATPERIDV